MRIQVIECVVLLGVAAAGCGTRQTAPLTAPEAEAVVRSVRAFAEDVARDVTQQGPAAWARYFEETPSFFMASEGKLEFANGMAANAALPAISSGIKQMELRWEGPVRVDPLGPGLAGMGTAFHEIRVDPAGKRVEASGYLSGLVEIRDGRWQFRHAHWSVAARK